MTILLDISFWFHHPSFSDVNARERWSGGKRMEYMMELC
jgi:hypothetical protein